jgi:hypothetical protein
VEVVVEVPEVEVVEVPVVEPPVVPLKAVEDFQQITLLDPDEL